LAIAVPSIVVAVMTNGVLENSLLWETQWVEKGRGATLEVGVKMDGRPKHRIRPRDLIKTPLKMPSMFGRPVAEAVSSEVPVVGCGMEKDEANQRQLFLV
jgi:hypothetical protein